MKRRTLKIFAVIALIPILLVALVLVFAPSFRAGWHARHVLESASTVEVTEYRGSTFYGHPGHPLTTQSLTRKQITRLADSFGRFELPDPGSACLFSPHHVIRCRYSDGTTHEIALCFSCGHIAIDSGDPLAVGDDYMQPIREALRSIGVPVRERSFYKDNAEE